MSIPKNVITKVGRNLGPTVAVFGGVHGNERAGVLTIDRLAREIEPHAGTVHLVYANPPAIGANVRLVEKNLNRLFIRERPRIDCFEDRRADELMDLLDSCDALLDLHSYPSPVAPGHTKPFAICEPRSMEIVSALPVPIIVHGFTDMEPGGTDGYMARAGKIGVCVELGAIERPDYFLDLGMDVALAFLARMGCIPVPTRLQVAFPQRRLRLTRFHKRQHEDFAFLRPQLQTFDRVAAGETIAIDAEHPVIADHDGLILFPATDRPVGVEAFLLTREAP